MWQERIILEVFQTFKHRFIFLVDKPSFKQLSENKEVHCQPWSHVHKHTQCGQVLTPACVTDRFGDGNVYALMLLWRGGVRRGGILRSEDPQPGQAGNLQTVGAVGTTRCRAGGAAWGTCSVKKRTWQC